MFILGLVLGVLSPGMQADADRATQALVEQLHSEKPAERDDARRKLKALGRPALLELQRAARGSDAEVAASARELIRVIELKSTLSPRILKEIPGIEERLALENDETWTELFQRAGTTWLPSARAVDLQPLAERAVRGARTQAEKMEVCSISERLRLRSAAGEIRKFLREDNRKVRLAAAVALGELGDRRAIPDLVRSIDAEAEDGFFDALEQLGAKQELLGLLQRPEPKIRGKAMLHLRNPDWSDVVPEVLKCLEDPDPSNRGRAASILGVFKVRQAIPQMIELLKVDDFWARHYSMQALASMEAKEAIPEMIKVLDAQGQIRERAAWALALIGAREAVPRLIALLKDEEFGMRLSAASALAYLGAREAVPALLAMTEHPEYMTRKDAIETLAELRATEAIPRIRKLLKDENPAVVWTAVVALSSLDVKDAIAEIAAVVEDPNASARAVAVRAVSRLGGVAELPRLLKWLEVDSSEARAAAIRAVGELGGIDHVPALMKGLKDRGSLARAAAAEQLGRLGVRSAVPAIEVLLQDEFLPSQAAAAEALCRLGSSKAIPKMLGWRDRVVFLNALRQPEEWKRLELPSGKGHKAGPMLDLLEELARRAQLTLELSRELPEEIRKSLMAGRNPKDWKWDYSMNLREAFRDFLREDCDIILEKGRLRIVSTEEAMSFWEAWSEQQPR